MSEIKKFNIKIWYTNTRPVIRIPEEAIKDLPIKLEEPLMMIIKEKSIEIFNSEIPTIK